MEGRIGGCGGRSKVEGGEDKGRWGAGAAACRMESGDGPKADRGVATSVDSLIGAGKSIALRGYSLRPAQGMLVYEPRLSTLIISYHIISYYYFVRTFEGNNIFRRLPHCYALGTPRYDLRVHESK